MVKPTNPADVLDAASKIVELPGVWHQGSLGSNDVHGEPIHACAIGSIYQAVSGRIVSPRDPVQFQLAYDAAKALSSHVCCPLIHWNDCVAQSADEVATAMRDAAREWRVAAGSPEIDPVQPSSLVV